MGTEEGQGDPRTPIDSVAHFDLYGSLGYVDYVITEPGSYYLTHNIDVSQAAGHGIVIEADHVSLDLNGYVVHGRRIDNAGTSIPPTSGGGMGDGIHLKGNRNHIVIKNGFISNCDGNGISGTATRKSVFQQLNIALNGRNGIEVDDQNVFLNTSVTHCYYNGFDVSLSCHFFACRSHSNSQDGFQVGSFGKLEDCNASFNTGTGILATSSCAVISCVATENKENGVKVGLDSFVEGVTVMFNRQSGIEINSDCIVANSTAFSNGTLIRSALADSTIYSGIRIIGNGGYVFNNLCSTNQYAGISGIASIANQDTKIQGNQLLQNKYVGLVLMKNGGLVIQNYAGGTGNGGPGFSFRGTATYGPIIQVKAAGDISTVPNANHVFANFNF